MYLERVTKVLEIAGQSGAASVSEICARSDLPKPTAYRLVQDLVSSGLLDTVAPGRFAPGARLHRIARTDQSDTALRALIAPHLQQAARDHGTAFFLSRLKGETVEIIHVETPDTGVSFLHPGIGTRPLHACSCAKAIVALAPNLLTNAKLKRRLKSYTEHTLTSAQELETGLSAIRARGYAECVEEIERGMCSVAAPVAQTGFGASLAIGTSGTVRVLNPRFRSQIGAALQELAGSLAQKITAPVTETD